MKKYLILALSMLAAVSHAQTGDDLKRSSTNACSLSAKMVKQNAKRDVQFQTDYGSSSVDKTRQNNYECSVRWLGKTNVTAQLEYIFMFSDGGKATPGEPQIEELELEPSKTQIVTLASPEVTQNDTKLVMIGEYSKEGINLKGLVLRLKRNGEIIKVWTSDGSWLKHAWKKEFNLSNDKYQ